MSLPVGVGPAMMAISCGALDGDAKKVRAWVQVLAISLGKAGEVELANYFQMLLARKPGESVSPRFAQTSCSSCGCSFGPGDHGFSRCENHKGIPMVPSWMEVF